MFFLLLLSSVVLADDIYLKNGTIYKNTSIIDSTNELYRIKIYPYGSTNITKADILSIVYSAADGFKPTLITMHNNILFGNIKLKDGSIHEDALVIDSTDSFYSVQFRDGVKAKLRKDLIVEISRSKVEQNKNEYLPAQFQVPQNVIRFNPDGQRVSLHITPYFNGGNYALGYKESVFNSRGVVIGSKNIDKSFDYESQFGIQVQLKIPVGNYLTISPFFNSETLKYKTDNTAGDINNKVYEYKTGTTFSIYF